MIAELGGGKKLSAFSQGRRAFGQSFLQGKGLCVKCFKKNKGSSFGVLC